jgi:hypothetical protein
VSVDPVTRLGTTKIAPLIVSVPVAAEGASPLTVVLNWPRCCSAEGTGVQYDESSGGS